MQDKFLRIMRDEGGDMLDFEIGGNFYDRMTSHKDWWHYIKGSC